MGGGRNLSVGIDQQLQSGWLKSPWRWEPSGWREADHAAWHCCQPLLPEWPVTLIFEVWGYLACKRLSAVRLQGDWHVYMWAPFCLGKSTNLLLEQAWGTMAVGDPCWGNGAPEGLWPWLTHDGPGTSLRDCGSYATHNGRGEAWQEAINHRVLERNWTSQYFSLLCIRCLIGGILVYWD